MLEILQLIVNTLIDDSVLTDLCPAANIFVGQVDVTEESQASLLYPQIQLSLASEVSRTVPLNARDTIIQIDIWSRQNQLEVVNIYEQIINDLNYLSGNQSTAHIFWERLGSALDLDEGAGDRRFWRRTMSFRVWAMKP